MQNRAQPVQPIGMIVRSLSVTRREAELDMVVNTLIHAVSDHVLNSPQSTDHHLTHQQPANNGPLQQRRSQSAGDCQQTPSLELGDDPFHVAKISDFIKDDAKGGRFSGDVHDAIEPAAHQLIGDVTGTPTSQEVICDVTGNSSTTAMSDDSPSLDPTTISTPPEASSSAARPYECSRPPQNDASNSGARSTPTTKASARTFSSDSQASGSSHARRLLSSTSHTDEGSGHSTRLYSTTSVSSRSERLHSVVQRTLRSVL